MKPTIVHFRPKPKPQWHNNMLMLFKVEVGEKASGAADL